MLRNSKGVWIEDESELKTIAHTFYEENINDGDRYSYWVQTKY